MYVFTSAFFFLMFFTFFNGSSASRIKSFNINGKTLEEVDKMDSAHFADFTRNINKDDDKPDVPMTRAGFKQFIDTMINQSGIHFSQQRFKSKAEFDSLTATGKVTSYWWLKPFIYKEIELNKKYDGNSRKILDALKESMIHGLPQMLFISLPLLALLLKLLYFRRKQFYYVNHAIFSIHLYIFVFIALLITMSLARLNSELHWGLITFIGGLLYVALFFYEYKAMRNFYQQGRGKTILKFILLNLMFLIVLMILFSLFILFSFYKI